MSSIRNSKKECVLVTGGAGYIGSHVVRDLDHAGFFPVIVDNLSTGSREAVLSGRLVIADIADSKTIRELIKEYDIRSVFHFAAFIQVEASVKDPLKYYENNSVYSYQLIRSCIECGVENFIFSSTAAVYGIPDHIPVNEDAPLCPVNPYGASKLFSEMLLHDVAIANPQFRYVSLRYFNVTGADQKARIGQNYDRPTHLITLALKTALKLYPELKVFGTDYQTLDGSPVRDYVHVDDLSVAHLLALDFLKRDHQNRIFNCGYNQGHSVFQVIESVKRVTGIDFPVILSDRRKGDPPELIADSSRIRTELGWKPKYLGLDEMIQTAWNWEKKLYKRKMSLLSGQ